MEYAEAMTRTPPTVTDELAARLLAALGPATFGVRVVDNADGNRIVGADGSLTGYAGGLAIKRALLALEAGMPELLLPV